MKIHILAVGRLKDEAERSIVERYTQRFEQTGRPLGFGGASVVELSESKAPTAIARKAAEATELRRRIVPDALIMALDERGKPLESAAFAELLGRWRDDGVRNLCVLIGGPDGLDKAAVDGASLTFSLGRITLPHGLARVVLAEQLYRAATILAGHPYHRS